MVDPNQRIIYLIAGEPSGDALGAHLMRAIKAKATMPVIFAGIGGEQMEREGIRSLFPYHELSMMGLAEIVPHIFKLLTRIEQTCEDIKTKSPHVVITIDSPGFCKRVVKKLRKEHFETYYVHYVAPSVWAWRPKRAVAFAELFDHLLTLLPFEPEHFERVGLASTFVGHPIVAETSEGNGEAFRKRYDLAPQTPLFTVLPGSRKGEIKRLLPIFARAIALLSESYPNLAICVPVPKHLLATVKPYFEDCPFRAIVTAHHEDKVDGFKASNVAIVKSGTVSLEVAKAGTPMIVAYRVNPLTAFIFGKLRLTKLATLVNILLGKEVIPELLQNDCTPIMVASAASRLLRSPEESRRQRDAVKEAFAMLTPANRTPSDIGAQIVLDHIA